MARESDRLGKSLRWDEREAQHVAAACTAADHVELLTRRLDAEVSGENRATILVQCCSEIRLQNKALAEHLGRLQLDEFAPPAKSAQHRAAALSRWGPQRPPKRVS